MERGDRETRSEVTATVQAKERVRPKLSWRLGKAEEEQKH